jgi:hypothetical protein
VQGAARTALATGSAHMIIDVSVQELRSRINASGGHDQLIHEPAHR